MSVISLPVCRWRREPIGPGRHACVSSRLIVGPRGVPDSKCETCHCRDHAPKVRAPGPCVHLGAHDGDLPCPTCPSMTGQPRTIPLHRCAVHGVCTMALPAAGLACCARCPDHQPRWVRPEAGQIRHLIYHVLPRGPAWTWNIAQLRDRMSLFNGRRIVSVAIDQEGESIDRVREELAGLDVEIRGVPNDRRLREMASYPGLLESLACYTSTADVHFYGHAKGVTSEQWAPAVRHWTTAMYSALLGHWPAVARELRSALAVGVYRRLRCGVIDYPVPWHYSGTFRWIRNADMYSRQWRQIGQHWCGSEAHVGQLYGVHETACLHSEFGQGGLGLYRQETWDEWAHEARRAWEAEHKCDQQEPLLATVILTAHNQTQRVHDAIASVQGQSADSWQLLIVDSGRINATGAYDRYQSDARIQVMLTGETPDLRAGCCIQSWAINEAWRRGRVRGDLIVHLCDDDVLDRGWLGRVIELARSRPDQSAWYGRAWETRLNPDGSDQVLSVLGGCGVGRPGNPLRCRIDGMQVAHRRHARTDWPEQRTVEREADGWWMDALSARAAIHPVDAAVGRHRHTPESSFTR